MTFKPYPKSKQTGNLTITAEEFRATHDKESIIQRDFEEWLEWNKIEYFRLPDVVWNAKLVNAGVRKVLSSYWLGKPDITIIVPDKNYPGQCRSLCIEIKSKHGRQRAAQKRFARRIPVRICRSLDECITATEKFLKSKD